MVDMTTVKAQLFRLGIVYSQKHSQDVWQILAEEWMSSLPEEMTNRQFMEAVNQAKTRAKFFPVPADVLTIHRELIANPEPKRVERAQIGGGDVFTEERAAKNKAHVKELLRRIKGGEPIYQN